MVEDSLMINNLSNKKVYKRNFSHIFDMKQTVYGCVSCPLVRVLFHLLLHDLQAFVFSLVKFSLQLLGT
jgi:hypothetical protein